MNLLDIQTETPKPLAQVLAETLLSRLNTELAARARAHTQSYADFWDHPSATPDDILASMGSRAALWLACAAESVGHIDRLASLVGKSVTDFIPQENFAPRRAFVMGDGGRVTLEPPAEGMDLHGRPL